MTAGTGDMAEIILRLRHIQQSLDEHLEDGKIHIDHQEWDRMRQTQERLVARVDGEQRHHLDGTAYRMGGLMAKVDSLDEGIRDIQAQRGLIPARLGIGTTMTVGGVAGTVVTGFLWVLYAIGVIGTTP